jgi:hypothetical protein
MKYLSACLLLVALAGCAAPHDLTACRGPYLSLSGAVAHPATVIPPVVAPAKTAQQMPVTR